MRGLTEVHILYPKKSQLKNLSTQKNHYFFSIPKKIPWSFFRNPNKIPLFLFLRPKKNPGVFHRPKKITFGQNFRPKNITRTPPPLLVIKMCEWGTLGLCYKFTGNRPGRGGEFPIVLLRIGVLVIFLGGFRW